MRIIRWGRRPASVAIVACIIMSMALILGSSPKVFADTFGNGSTTGMSAYAAPSGYVFFASFIAPSGGSLTSISFYAGSPSGNGNAGIYSDSSGKPGTLLVQGTPQALTNGWNTFSASASIVASTTYWLGFQLQNGNFYYLTSQAGSMRNWITGTTCCTMPSSVLSPMSGSGSYAVYATYSTGPPANDFTISANPPSQSIGAGSTASYTLTAQYGSGFSSTVNLAVTSGCPSGVTCSVTPSSVSASGTATLNVPTLVTTPGGTSSVTVTASSASPSLSHTVTVQLTVTGPGSYAANVHAGATQVVVTVAWTGPGTASATLAGPGGTPTLSESGQVVYDRLTFASGSSTPTNIHRVTFNISSYSPGSAQIWTVYVSLSASYTVTIEIS